MNSLKHQKRLFNDVLDDGLGLLVNISRQNPPLDSKKPNANKKQTISAEISENHGSHKFRQLENWILIYLSLILAQPSKYLPYSLVKHFKFMAANPEKNLHNLNSTNQLKSHAKWLKFHGRHKEFTFSFT